MTHADGVAERNLCVAETRSSPAEFEDRFVTFITGLLQSDGYVSSKVSTTETCCQIVATALLNAAAGLSPHPGALCSVAPPDLKLGGATIRVSS